VSALLPVLTRSFINPAAHLVLQDIQRYRSQGEYEIMKCADIEIRAKPGFGIAPELPDRVLAQLVTQRLGRPRASGCRR